MDEPIDIEETIGQLDRAESMEIYRMYDNASAKGQVIKLEECFVSKEMAYKLFEVMLEDKKRQKLLSNKHTLAQFIHKLRSLTLWMLWSNKTILPEDKYENFFDHADKQNSLFTSTLKSFAHFRSANHFLPKLFSIASETKIDYVVDFSTMPFYVGASVNANDSSIGLFLKNELEENENDDEISKKKKNMLRMCVKSLMGYHSRGQQQLGLLYTDKGHEFIKRLLQRIGLTVKRNNSRIRGTNGLRKTTIETPSKEFTFMLGLNKFCKSTKEILTMILPTRNLDDDDKEWLKTSISDFNDICTNVGQTYNRYKFCVMEIPINTFGVCIRQRIQEERMKAIHTANTLEEADAPTTAATEIQAAATIQRIRNRANRIEERFDRNLHNRYLEQAMNEVVDEDVEANDNENDNNGQEERQSTQNIFIEDMAEEDP